MKKRKIISAIILLSGLAFFLLIVNSTGKNQEFPAMVALNKNNSESGFDYRTDKNRDIIPSAISGTNMSPATDNLTELLAKNISSGILTVNSKLVSEQGTSSIALPSSNSLGNSIEQSIEQNMKFPVFGLKDIRIGSDNSPEAQLAYFNTIGEISKKNFGNFKTSIVTMLNNLIENNDSTALAKYARIANKQVADFLALKVPEQLSAWHLQNLNLWQKKFTAYSAMANLSSDPLKMIIAFKEVPNIVQETLNLDSVMKEKYLKLIP
ncbi:MAG: hypothetical protein AAB377_01460 [Patescibacteria group bacterium]|mgnify:FL=1